jgi:hypothetical protein
MYTMEKCLRYGALNVISLERPFSLTTVDRDLARYKLDFVGVEEVRYDKEGALRVKDYKFFYGTEIKIINQEYNFCVIIS